MRKPLGKIKSDSLRKRVRRKLSLRKKVQGTQERPRVSIFKSNKNISLQVVDDQTQKTLFQLQTFGKNRIDGAKKSVDGAKVLGLALGAKLKEKGITKVVFDRNGFPYHGTVKASADGLRESGIHI